ncbi:MAG: catalase [Oscillospiraceae bacterium]|nr:catalase [Oscillospiraceae bacterium]
MHVWGHLKTVSKHRWLVMVHCFQVGLYWRGLTHDLSKFSPTEFWAGARYYQGDRSPNVAEREANGYSRAWMHHKGRNRHHFEYWTDLKKGTREYVPVPMPTEYLVEMCMDRIAACKTYHGKDYADGDALAYLEKAQESPLMHPETMEKTRFLLSMLAQCGEKETFRFIRQHVLRGESFPQ